MFSVENQNMATCRRSRGAGGESNMLRRTKAMTGHAEGDGWGWSWPSGEVWEVKGDKAIRKTREKGDAFGAFESEYGNSGRGRRRERGGGGLERRCRGKRRRRRKRPTKNLKKPIKGEKEEARGKNRNRKTDLCICVLDFVKSPTLA